MGSFGSIVALVGLFWLVFSIVGVHVFGGIDLADQPWPNCDSLVNCLILNFHVSDPIWYMWHHLAVVGYLSSPCVGS